MVRLVKNEVDERDEMDATIIRLHEYDTSSAQSTCVIHTLSHINTRGETDNINYNTSNHYDNINYIYNSTTTSIEVIVLVH